MMRDLFLMFTMSAASLIMIILGLIGFPMMASAADQASQKDPGLAELTKIITEKDRQLFDSSFGNCDVATVDKIIAPDFEFYHDKGGETLSKAAFMATLKDGMCNAKNTATGYRAFRILTQGSLKVFPLYTGKNDLYAAVEVGEHSFYESYNGSNPDFRSVAKFTNLWRLEKGHWILARAISYDHQVPPEK